MKEKKDVDMATPMMKCGHAANATCDGKPCCVICIGPDAFTVEETPPSLEGRRSKCGDCGKESDSTWNLPFFEYRGPKSKRATEMCKCGYHKAAHEDDPEGHRMNVVKEGKCKGFEPRGPYEFDSHYDGCRGWD